MQKYTYSIEGLHCPSCVLVIEGRLEKEKGVKTAEVDLKKQLVTIESKKTITAASLSRIFQKDGYKFTKTNDDEGDTVTITNESLWWLWAIFAIAGFLILSQIGLGGFLNINSSSSLPAIFIFGLVAGFSSCGALLSGIILASPKDTKKIILGRILSYSILGVILGLIGQQLTISYTFTSILMIFVSLIMVVVALQMLEVKFARQINLSLPKSLGKKITKSQLPFGVGLLTVFLPCGFTLITESVAVLSGSLVRGFLIMLVFVIGTSIPLFLIGLSSDKLIKNQKLIGALILFFVLYNLNFQFGLVQKVFGQGIGQPQTKISTIPSGDAQLVEVKYSQLTDIVPNSFTFKVGQTVRMEIKAYDNGTGCMSTVMIPRLYNIPQPLIKGQKLVMEFTPEKTGRYQITCAMGVPRGEINVVE